MPSQKTVTVQPTTPIRVAASDQDVILELPINLNDQKLQLRLSGEQATQLAKDLFAAIGQPEARKAH